MCPLKYMTDPEVLDHLQKKGSISALLTQLKSSKESLGGETVLGVFNVLLACLKVRSLKGERS